jgi:hypothetical protein
VKESDPRRADSYDQIYWEQSELGEEGWGEGRRRYSQAPRTRSPDPPMATVFAEWDGHRRGLRDTPATIQDLTSAVRTAYGWSTEPLLKFSVRLLPPEQTALSESRRGAAGAAFQAFAPARVEAFAPARPRAAPARSCAAP